MTKYLMAKHAMLNEFEACKLDKWPKKTYTGREYGHAKSALHAAWIACEKAKENLETIYKDQMEKAMELQRDGTLTIKQREKLQELIEQRYCELNADLFNKWIDLRGRL